MKKFKKIVHHFFVPHSRNNYRAKALHHNFLTFYLVVAISLSVVFRMLPAENQGNVLGYATDISTAKLLELTNEERKKNNLGTLNYSEQLAVAAEAKAKNMFELNYWAHYSPSGATPWNYILASGYQYEYAGENLAKNFLFSDGVVKAWMESPSHRENLLRPEYADVGFAVANGVLNGEETTLVVQMFGKPLVGEAASTPPKVQAIPEQAPQPKMAVENKAAVLPQNTQSFPIMKWYRNGTLLFFLFLVVALVVDFYVAAKLNIVRFSGKNIIHAMFIGFMLVAVWMLAKGAII